MKKLIFLCLLGSLAVACDSPEPNPNPPQPIGEHVVKALFKATPATFTAEGGTGAIEGVLQEFTLEGKLVSETPLSKSDFSLSLKSGDPSQIALDEAESCFTLKPGSSATFEIAASVTSGKAKGQMQLLTVVRAGNIDFSFSTEPATFTSAGGKGKVIGKCQITDDKGTLIEEKELEIEDFTITQPNASEGLVIHNTTKEFEVSRGNATTFEIEASCIGSTPQKLVIKREGKLLFAFKAEPNSFSYKGGSGKVSGTCKATDVDGNVVEETALKNGDFSLALKRGDASGISIDSKYKNFNVREGEQEENFVLEATALFDNSLHELTIHREAKKAASPLKSNPLEYVAEYNINVEGNGFARSQGIDESGYFSYDEAVERFSQIAIEDKDYYLPSQEEWLAIVPIKRSSAPDYVDFNNSNAFDNISETVMLGGNTLTSLNDYRATGQNVTYALRYKGTDMVSAWKYEFSSQEGAQILKITSRSVKDATPAVTIEEVQNPAFWETPNEKDIVRIFPACGLQNNGSTNAKGTYGFYWTATHIDNTYAWAMGFLGSGAIVYGGADGVTYRRLGFSIRLFCDQE